MIDQEKSGEVFPPQSNSCSKSVQKVNYFQQICGPYERKEDDAPHGEIQFDIGLCDVELCITPTKDLNNLLKAKQIPKRRIVEIKLRRRTLKNR